MKYFTIILPIFLIAIFCCNKNQTDEHEYSTVSILDLKNTKWIYKWDERHFDYFQFLDENKVEYYSAELGNKEYGYFTIKNNTIIVRMDSAKYYHEWFKNTKELIIIKDTLWINWVKIDMYDKSKIDHDYFFIKEEK